MSHTNKKGRYRRIPSIVLSSDEDTVDNNTNNNPIPTQYATPMAQIDDTIQMITKPVMSTTNQLSIIVRHQPSTLTTQRPQLTNAARKPGDIDLTPSMHSPHGLSQRNYLPYTLNSLNQERLSILPVYPTENHGDDQLVLLLVNIPIKQLSQQELAHRQQGKYKCRFSIIDQEASATSFMVQQYNTYYTPIIERLKIDVSILDYNYLRLRKFIQLCQVGCIRVLPSNRSSEIQFNLNEHEFPQLLEFYLQIDIDLFYMKTCSFREAISRMENEGIFCTTTPDCRYVVTPCGHCPLCCSMNDTQNCPQYSVAFNLYQKHRFVNGYESILNCPASCNTHNIIYVLTCQCGDYDFIGETGGNLLRRLSDHRCFTHRLILETLIGEKNYIHFWGGKTEGIKRKDSMRLYQHPVQCSSVIQSFLNQNMDYWIFVPKINHEANQENVHYQSVTILPAAAAVSTHNTGSVHKCLDALPKPPIGYKFSKFQIKKQNEFFTTKQYQKQVDVNYIVYNATVIAVLPLNTSDLFRRLIHSLFVTHAETKLNTLGHIFTYPLDAPISRSLWCANLRHPRY